MHTQPVKVMKLFPFITASIINKCINLEMSQLWWRNTLFAFFVQCLASVLMAKEVPVGPEQINVRTGDESLNFVGNYCPIHSRHYKHITQATIE
jgi:hypothetical protein